MEVPVSRRGRARLIALAVALLLVFPAGGSAHPGALDLSFGGGDGLVTSQLGPGLDAAHGVAITSDGGLIVAGGVGRSASSTAFNLGLLALDPAGNARAGVGVGGAAVIPTDPVSVASLPTVAQRSDGSYVVAALTDDALPKVIVDTASAAGVAA